MILLDTSAAIRILRGDTVPDGCAGESAGISAIVEMELELGVLHGGGMKERRRVDDFLSRVSVFDFDREAAREAATVLSELWATGRPIGDFDSQIAGHARNLALPLLTANTGHFKRVRELEVIPW